MSIRFSVTDRATGEVLQFDAPVRREFVKDGVRKTLPPKAETCNGIMAMLKTRSKLGLRGGVLA